MNAIEQRDPSQQPLLQVRNLSKQYQLGGGAFSASRGIVRAVDDVSFDINVGETLSLVGESGCGKSTVARLVLRILDPSGGEIRFHQRDGAWTDLAALPQRRMRPIRRDVQMVFQDPNASLNPRMVVSRIIGEPLRSNRLASGAALQDQVSEALRLVGLRPEFANRYPHAFSGGQRQRIGIARSMVTRPRLIVADEPVSALDVSVQAQILNLLKDLQQQFGIAYLFIAHDLGVVRHISDRIAVMYIGRIVEHAPRTALFSRPRHPYTEALISAIPRPNPNVRTRRILSPGDVADAANPPSGCHFHPRCSYATDICRAKAPPLEAIAPGHLVACHRGRELTLQGAGPSSQPVITTSEVVS